MEIETSQLETGVALKNQTIMVLQMALTRMILKQAIEDFRETNTKLVSQNRRSRRGELKIYAFILKGNYNLICSLNMYVIWNVLPFRRMVLFVLFWSDLHSTKNTQTSYPGRCPGLNYLRLSAFMVWVIWKASSLMSRRGK